MSYRFCSCLLLLALVASLVGCRPGPAPAAAGGDPVSQLDPTGTEVILWHSMSGADADELAALVDEFNAQNNWHIIVVPQYQGVYSALRSRLDDALQRGASPDLVTLYPYHAAAYAQKGLVVPLDPYASSARFGFTEADRADIWPVFLKSDRNPQAGGQWTSFPMQRSAMVLYYNADWLKSLGYQGPPLTWPAFKEMCQRATADLNGDGPPDTYGWAMVPDASIFSALVLSRGGTLTSDDGRQAKFNSTEGVKAMNILRDVFPFRQAYEQQEPWVVDDFAQSKTLFTIAPSSQMPTYKKAVEQKGFFRWGVAPLPHNTPDPVVDMTGTSWAVFKTTPQRQLAAWLFIRWFTGSSQARRWADATSTLPLRNSAAQALGKKAGLDPQVKVILDLLPYGQSEPVTPGWEPARQVLANTLHVVATGTQPPAALEQAEAKVNSLLK